ncbi:MAG: ATP-binding cassette domain-containing protein [Thermoleophilia bacterium]
MDAISAASLRKSFGKQLVLDDIGLKVSKGSVFCLLGPNGAGKTTTINILTTLLRADGGTATVNGFDVVAEAAKVRAQISLTGQFAAVDEVLTARENLVLIGDLRHIEDPARTAEELLERFSLQDAADRRTGTFSGGMRRRLDIAMGLIGDPPVIFFDEPTSGLDPLSRNMMWETIKALSQGGTTVFLTTQNLEEADRLADRIAILSQGRIVAEGTAGELKRLLPHGRIELGFPDTGQMEAAARLFQDYDVTPDDGALSLTIATDGSVAQIVRIFNRIENAQITVSEFSQKTATLDDAFLKIISDSEGNK